MQIKKSNLNFNADLTKNNLNMATSQSKNHKFFLSKYRRSIFVTDNIFGFIIIILGLLTYFIFGFDNVTILVILIAFFILTTVIFTSIKKEKYIFACYCNLIGSIALLTVFIIAYGNHLNLHFFLLSISLNAFIYTTNEKFNQVFFIIHLAFFLALGFLKIEPILFFDPLFEPTFKNIVLVLFALTFLYKGILITKLYINTSTSANKKYLIYKTLFDNSYDGIITTTYNKVTKQLIESKNNKILYFFDAFDDELSINNLANYFPTKQPNGKLSAEYFKNITQLKEGSSGSFKFTFKKKNGDLFNALITTITIQEILENITIYLFKNITQEVTNRRIIKFQVEELNEKNIKLQKYIDNKLQFENLAHLAAHDLKTPIRTLVSFSQILEDSTIDKISKEEKNYIDFIKKAASKVSRLITGLSNFAELNAESFKFEMVNLDQLQNKICEILKIKFADNAFTLSFHNLPNKIFADKIYLYKLFYELITNAVNFKNPQKQAIININYFEKKETHQFNISDNGIGITIEDQANIFTIFKKANATDTNNAGIGLATCSKIVEIHKGVIWIDSQLNEGSTFSFTISKGLANSQITSTILPKLF